MILRVAMVLCLLLLLTACAGRPVGQDLRGEFASGRIPAYLADELRAAPQTDAPAVQTTADVVAEVEQTLRATKARWEAELAAPATATRRPAFAPVDAARFQALAAGDAFDATLADAVDLDTLVGLVQQRHPGIRAATENLRATLEQYPQAVQLDTILRQYNAFTKELDTKIGPQQHKQMMAMQFPYPDALALKGRLVDTDVAIAERQVEIARRDAVTAVRLAYVDLLYVDQAIAINRATQALVEQAIDLSRAGLRTGQTASNTVVMAQMELAKLADGRLTLTAQRETVAARVNSLLSRPVSAALGPPLPLQDQDLVPDLAALTAIALEQRQELQQQRLRIARTETLVELATRMARPDPTLGASYYEADMLPSGAGAAGAAAPSFMTRRELNQPQAAAFGQRDAYIQEVRVKLGAMAHLLTEMQDRTALLVQQEHTTLQTAKRSIALYRHTLLPQTEQALASAQASYRAGETAFLMFLEAERSLLMVRLAEQQALRDLRAAQARLEQTAGQELPRRALRLPTTADGDATNDSR